MVLNSFGAILYFRVSYQISVFSAEFWLSCICVVYYPVKFRTKILSIAGKNLVFSNYDCSLHSDNSEAHYLWCFLWIYLFEMCIYYEEKYICSFALHMNLSFLLNAGKNGICRSSKEHCSPSITCIIENLDFTNLHQCFVGIILSCFSISLQTSPVDSSPLESLPQLDRHSLPKETTL